ncbi:orotidine-5'-phosphate decarboxylase [Thiohalobacter thiocyanaticus]
MMTQAQTDSRVIVALDYPDAARARDFVGRLTPGSCRLKIGKELFTRAGPALVEELQGRGFEIFLDLKFHDIPNTVARACEAAADLGVWMVNVHTLGGSRMMVTAREALERRSGRRPLLIGVTILTSMGEGDLAEVGLTGSPADNVARLAGLAQAAGLDGVVCSPQESRLLSGQLGSGFVLVTPGVRPAGSTTDDQQRIMTPADALAAGSHYLVIGRPITQAEDPVAVLEAINRELAP